MAVPGFADPATASLPQSESLYFGAYQATAEKNPGELIYGGKGNRGQQLDWKGPSLMFGEGTSYTGAGEEITKPQAQSGKGHWSEILNFHGSPAPWILIGILLVAGILHLSAKGKFGLAGEI